MRHFLIVLLLIAGVPPAVAADLLMFSVGGQSNIKYQGPGTASESPRTTPGKVLKWFGGAISDLGQDGSALPAFAETIYQATGTAVMLVPTAITTTSQCAASDLTPTNQNWDTVANGGVLTTNMLNTTAAAITAATNAGWNVIYKGVLWHQGENDAWAIDAIPPRLPNNGTYKNCFLNGLVQPVWAAYPGSTIYVARVGTPGTVTAGFGAVMQGQEDIASYYRYSQAAGKMLMVFRGASKFLANGLYQKNDSHYLQAGYNALGRYSALGYLQNGIYQNQILIEGVYPNATRSTFTTD